jgi:hypothetical protein
MRTTAMEAAAMAGTGAMEAAAATTLSGRRQSNCSADQCNAKNQATCWHSEHHDYTSQKLRPVESSNASSSC